MRNEALTRRRQLHSAIEADIARRTAAHKAKVAALKSRVGAVAGAERPLILLAHGDSWFNYPLDGNGPSLSGDTDIIAQLGGLGAPNPLILNLSHYGDATTAEMGLSKQQRMIAALSDPDNWVGAAGPDAILFSGGGDDIAGDQFCIFLDANTPGSPGLDPIRFAGVLGMVQASYLDLFAFRDRFAPGAPIFGHDYDFPTPNGVHPICIGPWLKPSLDFQGWTGVAAGAAIVRDALNRFRVMLEALAAAPANNFHLVPTQGALAAADWANELHPTSDGFGKLAALFAAALAARFPGRI